MLAMHLNVITTLSRDMYLTDNQNESFSHLLLGSR